MSNPESGGTKSSGVSLFPTPSRTSSIHFGETSARNNMLAISDASGEGDISNSEKNDNLGGAVAAVPETYKACGLWTALTLNVILGLAVTLSLHELIKSTQKVSSLVHTQSMSYPVLAEASLVNGPWIRLRGYSRAFRHLVETMVCINLFGACCVYQVMLARTLKQLVEGGQCADEGRTSLTIYIACLLLPCALISLVTNLKYLAPFAVTADVCIVATEAATVYYGCTTATIVPIEKPVFNTIPGVFEMMGATVFIMEGMGIVLATENDVNTDSSLLALITGMTTITLMVMTIGFFGYWGFGEESRSPIILNFPSSNIGVNLKMFFLVMTYVSFGLTFHVPFNIVWGWMSSCYSCSSQKLWKQVNSVLAVALVTGVAVGLPVVTQLLAVLGSVCMSCLAFIFPAFISLSLEWVERDRKRWWQIFKFTSFMLIGLTLLGPAAAFNIWGLVQKVTDPT